MRAAQVLLRLLQVGAEDIDVVQPAGCDHGLRVALDELQGVGVVLQLFHQPEDRRHVDGVGALVLDASQGLLEAAGLDGHDTGATAPEDDDDDHEGHQDQRQQRDHDEQGVLLDRLGEPVGSVHGIYLFLRCSRTSI